VTIDVYDPAEWEKYNWAIWQDDDFTKKFDATEQKNAKAFFIASLARGKRFQAALDANTQVKPAISFYLFGGDCKETPAAVLLLRDEKKNRWETHFKADGFTRSNGEKVKDDQIKPLLFGLGDSVVTKRSLTGESFKSSGKPVLPITAESFQCEGHTKLVTSPVVQDKLFAFLTAAATVANTSP
jgi:hypothetical protein